MQKRGQSALESLTTYGWALIVILVIISALSYFGIINPINLLPDRCDFGPEINCQDHIIGNNQINLRLKNNLRDVIGVDAIDISTKRTQLDCSSSLIGSTWNSGEVKDVVIFCNFNDFGLVEGEKEKLNLRLSYYPIKSGRSFAHELYGEIFTVLTTSIMGESTVTDPGICQNAETSGLCNGLDLVFGEGHKDACCSEHGLCC